MPKVISFASQKGGPGKTTITMLAATQMAKMDKKIIVLDADFPQHSLSRHRQRDLDDLKRADSKNRPIVDIFYERGITPFTIFSTQVAALDKLIPKLKSSDSIDYIFIDLPGTLNVEGIQSAFNSVDLIIVPAELEFKSIVSAMETIDFINKKVSTNKPIKFSWVWSKLKSNHKKKYKLEVEAAIQSKLNVSILTWYMPNTESINQEVGTIIPIRSKFKVGNLVQEIFDLAAL